MSPLTFSFCHLRTHHLPVHLILHMPPFALLRHPTSCRNTLLSTSFLKGVSHLLAPFVLQLPWMTFPSTTLFSYLPQFLFPPLPYRLLYCPSFLSPPPSSSPSPSSPSPHLYSSTLLLPTYFIFSSPLFFPPFPHCSFSLTRAPIALTPGAPGTLSSSLPDPPVPCPWYT